MWVGLRLEIDSLRLRSVEAGPPGSVGCDLNFALPSRIKNPTTSRTDQCLCADRNALVSQSLHPSTAGVTHSVHSPRKPPLNIVFPRSNAVRHALVPSVRKRESRLRVPVDGKRADALLRLGRFRAVLGLRRQLHRRCVRVCDVCVRDATVMCACGRVKFPCRNTMLRAGSGDSSPCTRRGGRWMSFTETREQRVRIDVCHEVSGFSIEIGSPDLGVS